MVIDHQHASSLFRLIHHLIETIRLFHSYCESITDPYTVFNIKTAQNLSIIITAAGCISHKKHIKIVTKT